MGGAEGKYLQYDATEDLFVGQCAFGLNQLKQGFLVSHPYFDF